jgi:hypothetical protein
VLTHQLAVGDHSPVSVHMAFGASTKAFFFDQRLFDDKRGTYAVLRLRHHVPAVNFTVQCCSQLDSTDMLLYMLRLIGSDIHAANV